MPENCAPCPGKMYACFIQIRVFAAKITPFVDNS